LHEVGAEKNLGQSEEKKDRAKNLEGKRKTFMREEQDAAHWEKIGRTEPTKKNLGEEKKIKHWHQPAKQVPPITDSQVREMRIDCVTIPSQYLLESAKDGNSKKDVVTKVGGRKMRRNVKEAKIIKKKKKGESLGSRRVSN